MAIISKTVPVILVNSTALEIKIPLKAKIDTIQKDDETGNGTVVKETLSETQRLFRSRTSVKIKKPQKKLNAENEKAFISIAANSAIRIDKEILELYDYEPFIKKDQLRMIEDKKAEVTEVDQIITNKTARKIGIHSKINKNSEIIIPAFGSRRIDKALLEQHDYQAWKDLNLIEITQDNEESEELQKAKWTFLMVWLAYGWFFVLLLKWIGLGIHFGKPGATFPFSVWLVWPAMAILITLVYLMREVYIHKKEGLKKGFVKFTSYMYKFINMLGLYLWPVIVPIGTVLFFGGVLNVVLDIINASSQETLSATLNFKQTISDFFTPGLLLRLLQLLFIIILSTIPGMLYFQYERRQIGTLRTQFLRNIMFLNPLIHTTDDAEIKYGNLVDEVTVSSGANSKQFSILRSGRPILLATMLITLCWIFTFWPVGEVPSISSTEITDLLMPQMNLISFAFLGAYFFALNLIFKRYSRGDLSPKAYSHVSIRVISAIIIVWVLGIAVGKDSGEFSKGTFYVMAFGIGLVPETGITWMKQILESKTLRKIFPNFRAKHPITDLEGISLYDKARLTEEGVESVETLAHHNLIELMLRSGIPVARIVDLVDQAILYLHTTGIVMEEKNKGDKETKNIRGIDILREEGIRTATDLLAVEKSILHPEKNDSEELKKRRNPETFYSLLDQTDKKSFRMQRVIDALIDDEWLVYVKNWRNLGLCQDTLVTDPNEIIREEMKMAK